jgi:hypothetical protein
MKGDRASDSGEGVPMLYYRTREQIEAYRDTPAAERLEWLLEQMEFLHKAMPPKAKVVREKLFGHG